MKGFGKFLVSLLLVLNLCFFVSACDMGADGKEYRILYADGTGTHTITVKNGEIYQLENLPQQTGYTFLGLFDAEEGGKQYVHANGIALSPFSGKTDLLLYAQFAPVEYTVDLNYNGAEHGSSAEEIKVLYNEKITGLPTDLTLSGKRFDGWWYAPENSGGVPLQVCDANGAGAVRLNETNFELPENKIITLNAVFVVSNVSVKLHYDEKTVLTVTATYGDLLSNVVPFKDVNGKAVSAWSTEPNDTALAHKFEGALKEDKELYAAEYSSYIAFDTDGGEELAPVLGTVGTEVMLPTPVKRGSEFTGWVLPPDGTVQTTATIGETGVTFQASWRAYKASLNANGGANVPSEVKAGSDGIARLPIPSKPNAVFAGWFDASQAFYWDGAELDSDLSLTAKWVNPVVASEADKWSEEYNADIPSGTLSEKTRVWNKSQTCTLPAELMPAIKLGKIRVNVSLVLKVWVRTKGNATATVKIDATVNGIMKNGPTMTQKGGGYNIWGKPLDGDIQNEVVSTLDFAFQAPSAGSFEIKLVYDMRSTKENNNITTDLHFLCRGLTVTVSNV